MWLTVPNVEKARDGVAKESTRLHKDKRAVLKFSARK